MENLSEAITSAILGFAPNAQILMLFLFSYGEGLPIVGTILPGGTIAILAGSLSQKGVFPIHIAFTAVTIGSFLGDMTGFILGRKSRKIGFVKRLIEKESWQKNWEIFDRNFFIIVVFGKLVPGIRSAPSLLFGARNINFKKYAFYSLLGSCLWGFLGIFAGSLITKILGKSAIPFIVAVLILAVITAVVGLILKNKKKKI